jgi:hypothetical protein
MDKGRILKEKELQTELVSDLDVPQVTEKIAEFLYNYSLKTGQYFNELQPKILGGVAFWFALQKGQTMIMYNVHPKQWNLNRVIFELEHEERSFFEQAYNINFNGI